MINRCRGRLRVLVLVVFVLGLAGYVVAQEDSPDFWGTGTNFHFVSAEEFQAWDAVNGTWKFSGDGFWHFASTGTSECYAAVRLPPGSLVTDMTVIYYDADPSNNLNVRLLQHWVTAAGDRDTTQIGPIFQSSGAPGTEISWVDIDPDHTVRYIDGPTAQSYVLRVSFFGPADLEFRGVIISWRRQISPAPAVATFPDVDPGFWAFQEIEALAASGITTGFPDGTYRPFEPVTRAQMATFLARALGLHWPG